MPHSRKASNSSLYRSAADRAGVAAGLELLATDEARAAAAMVRSG